MKTTIDNYMPVFMVKTSTGAIAYCNASELNQVVKQLECRTGYFRIFRINPQDFKFERMYAFNLLPIMANNGLKMDFTL
jgi:hypothetical protein